LSRIIKADNLIVSQPKLLATLLVGKGGKEVGREESLLSPVSRDDIQDVEKVRAEVDSIIKETEQMVLDILEQARAEASHIIEDARDEAQEIRTQVRVEAEQIRNKARESGYKEGLQKAYQETEDRRKRALAECDKMLEEAKKEKEAIIRSAEGDIVRLALAVAEKIVEKEIQQDTDITINLVRNVLSMVGDAQAVKLRVSPEEFERLAAERDKLTGADQNIGELHLQPHSGIKPGGLILDSEVGTIDARVETRLQNIADALLGEG